MENETPALDLDDPNAISGAAPPAEEFGDKELDNEPAEKIEDGDLEIDAVPPSYEEHMAGTARAVELRLSNLRRVQRMDLTGDMVATAIAQAIMAVVRGETVPAEEPVAA